MNRTSIEWTDFSSNPIYAVDKATGKRGWFCEKVSPGCANCYASALNVRRGTGHEYLPAHRDKVEFQLKERELEAWRRRKKPARIFVGDMLDVFQERIPDTFLAAIWQAMADAPQHTFQVLTKWPERMRQTLTLSPELARAAAGHWPLPNVHLGVSVENQKAADERIPLLLETPAAVRFISAEPLLEGLNLWSSLNIYSHNGEPCCTEKTGWHAKDVTPDIDWVIVGGESGGPEKRRLVERCGCPPGPNTMATNHRGGCTGWHPKPEALAWVRSIRDQCQAAGVPFLFKQWGPKAGQGRLVDGREWNELPKEAVMAGCEGRHVTARADVM